MLRFDLVPDELGRGGDRGGIVGQADDRQHVGYQIERIDEVGERGYQRNPHIGRRLTVERAVVDGENLLGERGLGREAAELAPEIAQHARFISLQAFVVAHRHRTRKWSWNSVPTRGRQPSASLSISVASLMSSSVTPPASWVDSVTSTFL